MVGVVRSDGKRFASPALAALDAGISVQQVYRAMSSGNTIKGLKYRASDGAYRVEDGICPVCGRKFTRRNPGQIYCSDKCHNYINHEKYNQRNGMKPPRKKIDSYIARNGSAIEEFRREARAGRRFGSAGSGL